MKLHLQQNKPIENILLHIIFWEYYATFFGVLWGSYEGYYTQEFFISFIKLPSSIVIVYANLYFLIPRFLLQKKYIHFAVYLVLVMLIGGALQRGVMYIFIYPSYYPQALTGYWNIVKIIKYGVEISTVVFFTSLIKILKYWYRDQHKAQELAKENLEAQLQLLKGQIHPHFLFNTLNNLYALTLKKADCAPDMVLKLSELMDYMMHDANARFVSLEKEVNYIKNYIALEKVRYGSRVEINFDISASLAGCTVAPLLLLPFIENSFKHGVSGEIEQAWISLHLSVKEDMLVYKVENSKVKDPFKHSKRDYASGIGLSNLKKRLEIIYPGNYDLKIFDEKETFLAILKIKLHGESMPLAPSIALMKEVMKK